MKEGNGMRLIALNGGGKITEAVLINEEGTVLKIAKGEAGSQITKDDSAAFEHIREVIGKLKDDAEGEADYVFAGISGSLENKERHEKTVRFLRGLFPGAEKIEVLNDASNSFRSVAETGDGIVANCATGSAVFAISQDGISQVGGWGYVFSDEGSAFDLGKRAIRCALREKDGRGSKTMMTAMIEKKIGCELSQFIAGFYAGGRTEISDFASILLDAAKANDVVACKQLEDAASAVADMIAAAGRKLNCSLIRVALSGYMWENRTYYEAVDRHVGNYCQLLIPDMPKVYGAAVQAAQHAGLKPGREFRKTFAASYSEIKQKMI
ncbi:MAG: hypothetical protein CW338_10380 [Clostridiales bacterium]|nr:hypothetical protein [Clostridiales bacterium]